MALCATYVNIISKINSKCETIDFNQRQRFYLLALQREEQTPLCPCECLPFDLVVFEVPDQTVNKSNSNVAKYVKRVNLRGK